MLWSQTDLVEATAGDLLGDWGNDGITGVSIDSRTIKANELFVAIKGKRDGHNFINDAIKLGAKAALVDHVPVEISSNTPLVLVSCVQEALENLAKYRRKRSQAKLVAITGSVGKTSSKNMLKTILELQGKTHAAPASFNNYLGVPLTLANLPMDATYAVVEIGMNKPGEIEPLAKMTSADVVFITAIAEAHLVAFGDIAGIANEKAQIVKGLKRDGIAVLNAGTPCYEILKKQTIENGNQLVSFSGIKSDIKAKKIQNLNGKIKVQYEFKEKEFEFILSSAGSHFAENSLGVLLCVDCLGGDIEKASRDLEKWKPSDGRGSIEKIFLPLGNILLIDDSFNANPSSMKAALRLLSQKNIYGNRRVAVLGDMLELGMKEVMLHEEISSWPELAAIDIIHTVGPLMHNLHGQLPINKKGCHYRNKIEIISDLENILRKGDIVLVKSSKSVGLSSLVDAIRDMKR